MILVILAIGLIILGAGIALWCLGTGYYDHESKLRRWAHRHDGMYVTLISMGIAITFCTAVVTVILGYDCSTEKAINAQIEMYQEENQYIETIVSEMVNDYQDYETETFTKLTPQEIMVAVSMYPELKSNELAAEQMRIYVANNDQIKALRTRQIDLITVKWWLYFGG